ncbi:MAG: hypothetical protein ACLP9L_06640, partial [Thermoguttaceae bacterium]
RETAVFLRSRCAENGRYRLGFFGYRLRDPDRTPESMWVMIDNAATAKYNSVGREVRGHRP